jgi:hypothetical protein
MHQQGLQLFLAEQLVLIGHKRLVLRELQLGVFVYMPQESYGDHEQYLERRLGQVLCKGRQRVPTHDFEATTKDEHHWVLLRTPLQMQLHS